MISLSNESNDSTRNGSVLFGTDTYHHTISHRRPVIFIITIIIAYHHDDHQYYYFLSHHIISGAIELIGLLCCPSNLLLSFVFVCAHVLV
jgi:hypothetical protein